MLRSVKNTKRSIHWICKYVYRIIATLFQFMRTRTRLVFNTANRQNLISIRIEVQ